LDCGFASANIIAKANTSETTLIDFIGPSFSGISVFCDSGTHVPLAIVGIVPCKVSAENGPIEAGDLLVTASTPGYAMKGTDKGRMLRAVVGKALQPMREGSGLIEVLVTLQ